MLNHDLLRATAANIETEAQHYHDQYVLASSSFKNDMTRKKLYERYAHFHAVADSILRIVAEIA